MPILGACVIFLLRKPVLVFLFFFKSTRFRKKHFALFFRFMFKTTKLYDKLISLTDLWIFWHVFWFLKVIIKHLLATRYITRQKSMFLFSWTLNKIVYTVLFFRNEEVNVYMFELKVLVCIVSKEDLSWLSLSLTKNTNF